MSSPPEEYEPLDNATYKSNKPTNTILLAALFILFFLVLSITAGLLLLLTFTAAISVPLAVAIGAAELFGLLSLLGVFFVIKHLATYSIRSEKSPIVTLLTSPIRLLVVFAMLMFTLVFSDKENKFKEVVKSKAFLVKLAFKISFTITALALAVLPLLIVTGVLPLPMLGIVSFGGIGAIAASVGFLVALPLLATVVLAVLQFKKPTEWFSNPLANHKTQVVLWAVATAGAAALLVFFFPPLAIPSLTATTTLALIIVSVSAGIAVIEFVSLTGLLNMAVRWAFAGLGYGLDKAEFKHEMLQSKKGQQEVRRDIFNDDNEAGQNRVLHNLSYALLVGTIYAAAATTGTRAKDYQAIVENNYDFKGPFVVADSDNTEVNIKPCSDGDDITL